LLASKAFAIVTSERMLVTDFSVVTIEVVNSI